MDTEGVILGDHRHKESLFGDHGHGFRLKTNNSDFTITVGEMLVINKYVV